MDDDVLAAFALDALDEDERDAVAARLAEDAPARREVDELRETAALLALAAGDDAPPASLWARIRADIASEASPAPPPTGDGGERADPAGDSVVPMRGRPPRAVALRHVVPVAAAAAIALVVVGAWGLAQRSELADLRGEVPVARAADEAFAAPEARTVALPVDGQAANLRVAHLPDGTGFLVDDAGALAALGRDRTYQLWALVGDPDAPVAISAGVLGPSPGIVPFTVSGPVVGFAVTVEDAGGVVSSDQPPIAVATLS